MGMWMLITIEREKLESRRDRGDLSSGSDSAVIWGALTASLKSDLVEKEGKIKKRAESRGVILRFLARVI